MIQHVATAVLSVGSAISKRTATPVAVASAPCGSQSKLRQKMTQTFWFFVRMGAFSSVAIVGRSGGLSKHILKNASPPTGCHYRSHPND